jgi:hypothetical protein
MKKIIFLIALFISSFAVAQTYTADQSKKDFYVNGLLANDGLQSLNFLICFMKNTNISDFIDKGTYKALIDEKSCEKADGSDSTAEASAATATSAASSKTTTATGTVDTVEYTTQTAVAVTATDGSIDGKSWVELEIEFFGDQSTLGPATAFVKMDLQEDVSATNQLGTFTFTYDLVNDEAIGAPYNAPANTQMSQGYVGVSGNEITFVEQGRGAPIQLKLNKDSSTGVTQGIMRTAGAVVDASNAVKQYTFVHQFYFNDTSNVYCQNLVEAQEIQFSATGPENVGDAVDAAAFKTIADAATEVQAFGGGANVTGENCWGTAAADTKRTVYQYGTYNAGNIVTADADKKYDASQGSMSLRATKGDNASFPDGREVYAHASYWGSHVDSSDRSLVSDTTVFRNNNSTTDTNTYNLKQNFLQVFEITIEKRQLADLDKVNFFGYVGWLKRDNDWSTGMSNLGFPTTGSCNATDGNCDEYAGTVSVSGTGASTVVTFTITKGIDWNSGNGPFDLNTSFSFTAGDWATQLKKAGENWGQGWHLWDDTNRRGYDIPFEAFSNPVSTTDAHLTKSRTENKISASSLPSNLACLRNCLDATKMNQTMGGIFASIDNSTTSGTLNISPYKNVGSWFKEEVYTDWNTNGEFNAANGEFKMSPGDHMWIGGTKAADIVTYTVNSGSILDSSTALTWADGVSISIPSTSSVDVLTKISSATRELEDTIRNFNYYEKPYSLGTTNNYTRRAGHWFDMEVFENTTLNLNAVECDKRDDGEYQGYAPEVKKVSDNTSYMVNIATSKYYCSDKLHRGALTTTYRIGVMQRPEYSLSNATTGAEISISPPETLTFTVPASGMRYNFSGIDYSGQKFLLKFEGFGELHNIPGRVVNTCTGVEVGKYVSNWDQCYRYVHDFVIPDGTILVNSDATKPNVKVLGLRGDDFITKKTDSETATLATTYTVEKTALPAFSLLKNNSQSSSADYIGAKPTTGIINDGNPSVVHGQTVFEAN